jgi:hypothetical protein
MSPARGRCATLIVLTATNRLSPTAQVSVQGHPEGCSKISRGPALHHPGTNVAPTGALA